MEKKLSYVIVTPYTVAKSRTGGVLARLLSRLDLGLIGAQMIAFDESLTQKYADCLRKHVDPNNPRAATLLADYVEKHMGPSAGRRHRSLLLVFSGTAPCKKLSDTCGALYAQNRTVESMTGETIRDTYADLVLDTEHPDKVRYFEPAVLTPRTQEIADEHLALFSDFLVDQSNIVENLRYPETARIERTLVIIKPDNWNHSSSKPGTIIDMFSRTGLRIIGCKIHQMTIAEALDFYGAVKDVLKSKLGPVFGKKAKELLESEFKIALSAETEKALSDTFGIEYAVDQFSQIVEFMTGIKPEHCPIEEMSNPGNVKCMILVYEGENSVAKIREVLGPTDPLKAPGGTIRREFGSSIMVNTAHASDSPENAKREMGIVKFDQNNCRRIIQDYLKR
jgi:nucleoside diphosphate kinase